MQVKYLLTIFFLSCFLLLCVNLAQAQTWQSLNGPSESDVRDIVIKNDTVYAVAWDAVGIFKSATGSSQWHYSEIAEGEGPLRSSISGFLSFNMGDNGTYYAGGNGIFNMISQVYDQFFVSEDYGRSWVEYRTGIESCGRVSDIFITNNSLLVGCGKGIYRFLEEDNRFQQVGNSWVSRSSIFFQQQDTLLAGSEEGVEFSVNNGDSWTKVGPDTLKVYSISSGFGRLLFGTDHGLFQTEFIDQSWTFVENFPSTPVNALYSFQDKVLVGTDTGTFLISTDDSETQPVFTGLEGQRINVINGIGEILYVGTQTGLYLCNLAQNSCTLDGVPNSRIPAVTFQNNDTLIVSTSSKIRRYSTSSSQWDSLSIPINSARSIVSTSQDSILTISSRYFLSCSFEHGACDSTRFTGSGTALFDLKQNTAGNLFVTSREHVFKSIDKGENWEIIYTSPERINFSLVTFSDSLLFINSGRIKYNLATNTYDTLSKTVNLITQTGTLYSHGDGIHKSSDFGETWTAILQDSDMINSGMDLWKALLYDEEKDKLYAITTEGRVYVTENEGVGWGVNTEMHPIYMESAAIGPDGTLYMGTGNAGVFTNTQPLNPPISISNEEEPNSSVPKSFEIHQNYPNPFNPTTTIPYELNQAEIVSISLYNVYGQKVREYNLGYKSTGSHQYKVDLQHQASGVYFLRIRAGEHSQTIKISLIK